MTHTIKHKGIRYFWSPSRDLNQLINENEELNLSEDEARGLMITFYTDKYTV